MRRLRSAALAAALMLLPGTANAVQIGVLGHWELLRRDVPATMLPGARVDVAVRIRNRTPLVWSEDTRDRLAYHWRNLDGSMAIKEGERTHLPGKLAPGDAVDLVLHVTAPQEPGRYYLQIEPVRELRRWWGMPYLGRDLLIPVEVTVPAEAARGELAWSISQVTALPAIPPGDRTTAPLRLTNEGDTAWSPALGDRLSHHFVDAEGRRGEGVRTRLPGPVGPGESVDLTAEVLAPTTPGTYQLVWEPVREHVRWYGPPRAGEAAVPLVVTPRERLLVDPPALAIHAQTIADVDLLLRNAGDDLPDGHGLALSYHWRHPDGRVAEYDGLRTPLPALAAGEEIALPARVRGPAAAGPHLLEWALVRENIGWYPLDPPVDSTVDVQPPLLAWSLVSADWPWTLAAAHGETIRMRLRNSGSDTLSPETGDRIGYRWYDPAGQRLADEGVRTPLPHALAPGASLSLDVRVAGPTTPGPYTLEFGLVREHVAWAPTPRGAAHSVQIVRRSGQLQLLLVVATLVLLVQARRRRLAPLTLRCGPAAFAGAVAFVQTLAFADLAGVPLYTGGRALAASAAALPALLVLLAPRRLGPPLALLFTLVGAALLLADLLYMQMLGSIVPLQALRGGHQIADIGPSIRAMVTPDHLWLLAAPLAALLLAALWPSRHVPKVSLRVPVVALLVALTPICFLLALAMAGPLGARVFSEQQNAGRFGVLGAHLFDGLRTARDRLTRGDLSPARRSAVADFFTDRPPPPADAHAGVARGDNLLVIQCEAMQGWVLGARVGDQEVTPFLNDLRPRALHYTQLFDETAQGMTSDAEYAVLNSQLPLGQGAVAFLRADNHFLTLAHVLQGTGYSTLSAHPFKKGFWNRSVIHPRYGFDRSLFAEELGPGPVVGWGLADDAFFARMVPELVAMPRPFFAFLVTLSLHHPYDHFPEDLKRLDLGPLEGSNLGNYLHGMHHLDRSLAGLFADLADAGLLADTVVAIYGDHDSRLPLSPDHLRLAGVAESPTAPVALSLQLDRIAGLVALPGGQVHGEVTAVGGHIDLAPTLLHYLGVATPRSFAGRPLLPGADDQSFAVFSDGSAIDHGRVFAAPTREISHDGACFEHPSGARLERRACMDLSQRARDLLLMSRTVADHDLARTLADP